MTQTKTRAYDSAEELANTLTHGFGFILSITGLVLLLVFSALQRDIWRVVSFGVYGLTLSLLFLASTLYHSASHPGRRALFKRLDHCAIYLFIAGTYTPFLLIGLKGSALSWPLFFVVWAIAAVGITLKLAGPRRVTPLALATYLGMGWLIVFMGSELVARLPGPGFVLLIVGGLLYSFGVIFYATKRIPFNHAIWHVFVLGGSVCHFISLFFYVLPKPV